MTLENSNLTVSIPITQDHLESLVYDMRQSCSYWCESIKSLNNVAWDDFNNPNWNLEFYAEGEMVGNMNMENIKNNFSKFIDYAGGRYFKEFIDLSWDAIGIDVMVQCIVMEEVIYG